MLGADGVQIAVLQLIFPAPEHLHRLAAAFGKQRRFDAEVRLGLTAKAAAQQGDMHLDLLLLQPKAAATFCWVLWGVWLQAQISQPSLLTLAVAAGGSIMA